MVSLFTRDFYSIFFVFTSVYSYYSLSIFMTLFLSFWISLTLLSKNYKKDGEMERGLGLLLPHDHNDNPRMGT